MVRYRQFWDTEYSREGSIGAYVKAPYGELLDELNYEQNSPY